MRRKRLQEFANNLCQMLTARLNEDLEFLAELPDGVLEIDLLNGQAQHGHAGPISLHITDELKAWLHDQLNKSNIPITAITKGQLQVQIRTDRVKTDRKRIILFEFDITSLISTDEMVYSATLKEALKWYNRAST